MITEPGLAAVLGPDFGSADVPAATARRLAAVPPGDWARRALRVRILPGFAREERHEAPRDLSRAPLPRGRSGRALARGRKLRSSGHRTIAFAETIRRVETVARRVGITRVSDSTGLDRLGIPVWSAIRPRSRDEISVFNGKGRTHAQARAGALMEAAERHAAEQVPRDRVLSTTRALRTAVSPADLRLLSRETFDPDARVEWTEAWDLFTGESAWVPLAAVMLPYEPAEGALALPSSSNGLASGNTLEEAICHGLAELIERDALTIAAARGFLAPIAGALVEDLLGGTRRRVIRSDGFPELLDLGTVPRGLRGLVARFEEAGVGVSVLDVTSDLGIPCFRATAVDRLVDDSPLHETFGAGCDPVAEVALSRALTEAAQARAVYVQGAREDVPTLTGGSAAVVLPAYPLGDRGTRSWSSLRSVRSSTVRDDVRLMLAALRRAGIRRCWVKDLTVREIGIPVVKVIVPELEDWASSAIHGLPSPLGRRALEAIA